jgi:acyl carrier protein
MVWHLIKTLRTKKGKAEIEKPAIDREQWERRRAMWTDVLAIESEVKEIVAGELNKDVGEITAETNSYEEGGSVGNMGVLLLCEDAEQLETIGQLVMYIQQQLGFGADTGRAKV